MGVPYFPCFDHRQFVAQRRRKESPGGATLAVIRTRLAPAAQQAILVAGLAAERLQALAEVGDTHIYSGKVQTEAARQILSDWPAPAWVSRMTPRVLDNLTTRLAVVIASNMKARELFNRRVPVTEQAFAERVLWELPEPLSGSKHHYKYRLAFVVAGACVLRYDNGAGKRDHKHMSDREVKYHFVSVDKRVADFFEDAKRWRDENSND